MAHFFQAQLGAVVRFPQAGEEFSDLQTFWASMIFIDLGRQRPVIGKIITAGDHDLKILYHAIS